MRRVDSHGNELPGEYQVCLVIESIRDAFETWVHERGCELFPVPGHEDDLPSYGIGRGRP